MSYYPSIKTDPIIDSLIPIEEKIYNEHTPITTLLEHRE